MRPRECVPSSFTSPRGPVLTSSSTLCNTKIFFTPYSYSSIPHVMPRTQITKTSATKNGKKKVALPRQIYAIPTQDDSEPSSSSDEESYSSDESSDDESRHVPVAPRKKQKSGASSHRLEKLKRKGGDDKRSAKKARVPKSSSRGGLKNNPTPQIHDPSIPAIATPIPYPSYSGYGYPPPPQSAYPPNPYANVVPFYLPAPPGTNPLGTGDKPKKKVVVRKKTPPKPKGGAVKGEVTHNSR